MCQKGPEDTILSVLYFICVSLFYVSYDWAREVSEDTFDRDEWEFIARYLLLHLIHLNSYSHPHHVFILLILHRLSIPSIDSSFIIIVIRIARGYEPNDLGFLSLELSLARSPEFIVKIVIAVVSDQFVADQSSITTSFHRSIVENASEGNIVAREHWPSVPLPVKS